MGIFILRRLGVMVVTALCLTFIVFWLTNLYPNLEKLAKTQGNFRMSDEEVATYLNNRGYLQPMVTKYGQWLGVLPGYVIDVLGGGAGTLGMLQSIAGSGALGIVHSRWVARVSAT